DRGTPARIRPQALGRRPGRHDPTRPRLVGPHRAADVKTHAGRRYRRIIRRMAWLYVIVAGILETGFAICLKLSHGFSRFTPTVLFAVFALSSFGLLTYALRKIEV